MYNTPTCPGSEHGSTAAATDKFLDVIFRLDLNLRYVYISPAIEQYSGVTRDNFLGKTIFDLRSAAYDPDALAAQCREAIESGRTVQREFCVHRKHYRTRLIPELAKEGIVESLLGITEEITSQKRAEIALSHVQEQYYSLLQSVEGIVWELDYQTWRFTFVSKQAERLLGYPVERWLDDPTFWPDHLHPEDRDRTIEKCVYLSERNVNHELEYRMIRADGRTVWLRDIVTIEQRDGRTLRLRGVMVDMTERKSQEALRFGQNRILEMIATSAPIDSVLNEIMRLIESHSPDTRCGVGLLCEHGTHISRVVGPNLPESYKSAVKGCAIGPNEGSCGAAMYRRERIVVTDVHTDPLWKNYRELAKAHDLKACWSTPILTRRGRVLGVFAMHCYQFRSPSASEERLADVAAHLASIAIEREIAAESLRQSEERYRALVTATAQDVWRTDGQGQVFFVTSTSEQTKRLDTAVSSEEWLSAIHPDERERYLHDWTHALNTNALFEGEFRFLTDSGHYRTFQSRGVPIKEPDGTVREWVGTYVDITEHKNAEIALRESEERFRLVSLATSDAIYDWDISEGTFWRNESFGRLYAPDSPIRLDYDWWRDRIGPQDRARVLRRLEDAFRDERQFWSDEYSFRCPDGSYASVMDRGYILYDSNGVPVRMIGAMTDMTAYRESERALRVSEEQYRNVVETQTEMICRCLPDATVTFVNDAYCRYFGKTRDEIIGKSFLEFLAADEAQRVRELMKAALEGGHSGPTEHSSTQSGESTRWTEWVNYVLRDGQGGIEIQGIGRDITQQKLAEQALQRSQEKLRRSHAQIRELAGKLMKAQEDERRHIARELHDDLNQQIAGLSIGLSNIRRQLAPVADDVAHQIERIQESANRVANDIRRLSHKLHPAALEHAGLSVALRAIITEFNGSAGINFVLRVSEDASSIKDDIAICIYRIVQESVRNIVKYSGAQHAAIDLFVEDDRVHLQITDDGRGFDIDDARNKSGLGLVSMSERVSLLRGIFELQSTPGDGTLVNVRLPIAS